MVKKIFIASILLGICFISYAQTGASTNNDVKSAAENKQKTLLDNMALVLKGSKASVDLPRSKNFQQFLYQEELIDSLLITNVSDDSHSLKRVFTALKKSTDSTEFIYEGLEIGNIEYKKVVNAKSEKTDSNSFIVPVKFLTHSVVGNNVSNIKNEVVFTWDIKTIKKVKTVKVDGKKEKTTEYSIKKISPVSSVVTPIPFLLSERKDMLSAAQEKIIEWYENLPQTLDKQYSEQSISEIQPVTVTEDDIKADLPAGQIFTINNVKDVVINIDPYRFISESDRNLYTNPSASLTITPSFIVTVDNSFKNADIKVEYSAKEPVKPTTDSVKIERRDAAEAAISKLAQELSSYVSVRTEEQKERVESLFNSKESNIEVSYLRQNGTERIHTKTANKYLSLLKGSSLNYIDHSIELQDPNWKTIVVVVNQDFKSKAYSDYTQKKVYLTYDDEKKTYIIDKIEVVPNSTKKQ